MKILVYAHPFDRMGGTQVNTIDLAVALRDLHGHEVVLFARPGPLVKLAEAKGLRFLPAPVVEGQPSLTMMRALADVQRRERADLIHAWEWWQCFDPFCGLHLLKGVPMVLTDMQSNEVRRDLPKLLPITFGTPEFVEMAKAGGRRRVGLLLPPVNVQTDAPGTVDAVPFRKKYGLRASDLNLVTVSRLAVPMKSESLLRTMDAVRILGREWPLRFVIVGDGEARAELQQMAEKTNVELGRDAVVLTGELLDPRPAYAAADIVIGMGGSALRGMAFGKPVIVVGIKGFSLPLTPETADSIYYKGTYGIGDGDPGNARLVAVIRAFAGCPGRLLEMGDFSRQFVIRHFSLEKVSAEFSAFCCAAVAERPRFHVACRDGIRTALIRFGGRFVPDLIRQRVKERETKRLPKRPTRDDLQ